MDDKRPEGTAQVTNDIIKTVPLVPATADNAIGRKARGDDTKQMWECYNVR